MYILQKKNLNEYFSPYKFLICIFIYWFVSNQFKPSRSSQKKKTHKYICFVFQPKRQSRQSAWQKVYFSSFRFVGKSFSPTRRKVCNIMYVSVYVSILWIFFLYFTSSSLSSFVRPFGNLHCRKWCNTRFRTFG